MNQTVGEKLRAAREARGVSLPEAVKATHISLKYLQELENDHPEMFNSDAQARGFLRLYASFLGIPSAPLIEQWDSAIVSESEKPGEQEILDDEESVSETAADEDGVDKEDEKESGEKKEEGEERKPFSISKWLGEKLSLSALIGRRKKEAESTAPDRPEAVPESEDPEDSPIPDRWIDRSAEEIFKDIGTALRERRDALELTLSDVERFTNVKRMYLIAMDEGRFDDLPSTVQGRGMLTNYSKCIALVDSWVMVAC